MPTDDFTLINHDGDELTTADFHEQTMRGLVMYPDRPYAAQLLRGYTNDMHTHLRGQLNKLDDKVVDAAAVRSTQHTFAQKGIELTPQQIQDASHNVIDAYQTSSMGLFKVIHDNALEIIDIVLPDTAFLNESGSTQLYVDQLAAHIEGQKNNADLQKKILEFGVDKSQLEYFWEVVIGFVAHSVVNSSLSIDGLEPKVKNETPHVYGRISKTCIELTDLLNGKKKEE